MMQYHNIAGNVYGSMGACGPVDRALDARSEGLGLDSQCWPYVEVSGKLCIPHCLGPPSRNGYLVHRSKVGSIVADCIGAHLARRKVKSVEHALSWSLDSKQLPLPLPLPYGSCLVVSLFSGIWMGFLSFCIVLFIYPFTACPANCGSCIHNGVTTVCLETGCAQYLGRKSDGTCEGESSFIFTMYNSALFWNHTW